jgi:phage-related protein
MGKNRQRGKRSGSPCPSESLPEEEAVKPYSGWLYWRASENGRSAPQEAKAALPVSVRAGLDERMVRFRDRDSRFKDHKYLGSGVHELRYREHNNEYRVLFAIWGTWLVVLDVFYKNQRSTDFKLAAERLRRWKVQNGKSPSE